MTKQTYKVALLGLREREKQALTRIFMLSKSRECTYEIIKPGPGNVPQLLIVDAVDSAAMRVFQRLRENGQQVPAVMVDDEDGGEYGIVVQRPLMAMRVLAALDSLATGKPVPSRAPASAERTHSSTGDSMAALDETPAPAAPASTFRALVVDDSAPVRRQVSLELERIGVEVACAENGEKALELIDESSFDIIFLDVVMPGIDGYEVCKNVKRRRDRKSCPVVMLTGKSSPFDKVKGKLSGCDTYLSKPVSRREFDLTVEKYLKPAFAGGKQGKAMELNLQAAV